MVPSRPVRESFLMQFLASFTAPPSLNACLLVSEYALSKLSILPKNVSKARFLMGHWSFLKDFQSRAIKVRGGQVTTSSACLFNALRFARYRVGIAHAKPRASLRLPDSNPRTCPL